MQQRPGHVQLSNHDQASSVDELRNSALLTLQHIDEGERGALTVAESGKHIPFECKRFYYITKVTESGAIRGGHAHRTLEQAIFCPTGSFRLNLDDGRQQSSLVLDRPDVGVYLGPLLWHTMADFSSDCVILVVASAAYDPADYVRGYAEFLSLAGAQPFHK